MCCCCCFVYAISTREDLDVRMKGKKLFYYRANRGDHLVNGRLSKHRTNGRKIATIITYDNESSLKSSSSFHSDSSKKRRRGER